MLKLTNSFCRYLMITCENINDIAHVKKSIHLSCRTKKWYAQSVPKETFTASYIRKEQQLRLLVNTKKRFSRQQNILFTNAAKKSEQMSESLQPSQNHICYGGKFQISTEEACASDVRRMHFTDSQNVDTNNAESRSCKISPNFRVWEPVDKKSDTRDDQVIRFRVVSYNVLAQYLLECHPYLYTDCSPHNLIWKVRAARLYDEIVSLSPDILCLQEVQASHLKSFYVKFEKLGYTGIFKQKTGHRYDGCAIYYKHSLFNLVDQVSVEFYQPELPILNRDNIGIMVKLTPKNSPGTPIVVATTHLLYNPARTDVRLAQMQVFLAEIDRFAYYNNGKEFGHLPIILTGDFNSTPNSAVIKLLDRGHVSSGPFRDSSDWKKIGVTDNCQHLSVYLNRQAGRNTDFSMTKIYNSEYRATQPDDNADAVPPDEHSNMFNTGFVGHSLNLASVYSKVKPNGHHEATTFQDYWLTVDYIYFSCCSNLKLLERLRLPTATECEVLGQLPNSVYGSDHLSLGATFELKPFKSSL